MGHKLLQSNAYVCPDVYLKLYEIYLDTFQIIIFRLITREKRGSSRFFVAVLLSNPETLDLNFLAKNMAAQPSLTGDLKLSENLKFLPKLSTCKLMRPCTCKFVNRCEGLYFTLHILFKYKKKKTKIRVRTHA